MFRVLVRHGSCWSSCTSAGTFWIKEAVVTITWLGEYSAGRNASLYWTMASFIVRVGLAAQPATFLWSSTARALAVSKRHVHRTSVAQFSTRTVLRHTQRSLPLLLTVTGIAGAALGISSLATPSTLYCDGECNIWMTLCP